MKQTFILLILLFLVAIYSCQSKNELAEVAADVALEKSGNKNNTETLQDKPVVERKIIKGGE